MPKKKKKINQILIKPGNIIEKTILIIGNIEKIKLHLIKIIRKKFLMF
jgi:hypothetical protein